MPLSFAQTASSGTNAQSPPIQIHGYTIDVTLNPAQHSLTAQTTLHFTPLENVAAITFQLNPALHITRITDQTGVTLNFAAAPGGIHVTPAGELASGNPSAWTFSYSGNFHPPPHSSSIQLASIGDPITYLLYGSRWFPVAGNGLSRFTAVMHVHVPAGMTVVGSGAVGPPHPDTHGRVVYDFNWSRPGFPGTIIAGKFHRFAEDPSVAVYLVDPKSSPGGEAKSDSEVVSRLSAQAIARIADKEFRFFSAEFGATDTGRINIVELPDRTLPAASAPEIAAIAGNQMAAGNSFRLLANTIAHQWWGQQVSPATRNDAWITNGMCRAAELQYLDHISSPTVAADAIFNVSASALAYDGVPLQDAGRYPPHSPEFEAMTYDKGAMIFRMLQWQIGDASFQKVLYSLLKQRDESVSSTQLEKIAEAVSHENLAAFFMQWLQYTGAPTLQDKWILYRLGNNKGFRTTGEIDQDLDLFQMPVEIQVETEGKTIRQRIHVQGPQTRFTIDTFGIPRKITLDPDRRLLRNGNRMQVRVHILRGMARAARNDQEGAIQAYRAALALNPISSLANYRLGEVYFNQHNYQAAEGAFRNALNGDGMPKWIEVWSDLQLGKIFDASGQRTRAVNQYREAEETKDDTSGALRLADEYLQNPYIPPSEHPSAHSADGHSGPSENTMQRSQDDGEQKN